MVASKKTSESEDSTGRNGLDPAALQYLVANQKGLVNDPATQVIQVRRNILAFIDLSLILDYWPFWLK